MFVLISCRRPSAGGVEGEGGSSGEEWIMRGDLTKKKRKIVFGDGSDFKRPGWEEELIDFKRKLRMPQKLIQVSKPASLTMSSSPAGSLTGVKTPLPPPPLPPVLAPIVAVDTTGKTAAKENKVPGKKNATTPSKEASSVTVQITPVTPVKKGKGRPPSSKDSTPTKKLGRKGKLPPPQTVSSAPSPESESPPLDEPTIERAVEQMKAATVTANAKLAQKNSSAAQNKKNSSTKEKKKPVLSKATSLPAKKSKGKNSSSLDELPVLSPQMTILPNDEEETAVTTPVEKVVEKVAKKGIRRNKFKSGFDYIRKKKKVVTNADGSPMAATPKKVKVKDNSSLSRGWMNAKVVLIF